MSIVEMLHLSHNSNLNNLAGFMYLRFTQPPTDLYDWYEPYLLDEEEIDVKAGGGQVGTKPIPNPMSAGDLNMCPQLPDYDNRADDPPVADQTGVVHYAVPAYSGTNPETECSQAGAVCAGE